MVACEHCGLQFEKSAMIVECVGDKECFFCCRGCQGVYHLLQDEGLGSFYDKKGETTLHAPSVHHDDVTRFDEESFTQKYVTPAKDGSYEVSLVLEGIHCAACVWLNERVIHQLEGVIDATINFTTHKAKIRWNPERITLSKVIDAIRAIGYNAYPYDPKGGEARANKERKEYMLRLIVALALSMNVMWIALSRYLGYFSGMEDDVKALMHVAEFVLVTPVLFYSGYIYYRGAWYGLKNRIINMDFLIATGASAGYFYSIYAAFVAGKEPYFDSVGMIITFVLIGKFLEVKSKKAAVDAVDTMIASLPQYVTVLEGENREQKSLEEVNEGALIEIKAGDKIAFDGTIVSGYANLDVASITGESIPVSVEKEDEVISGSINMDGTLIMRVDRAYKESTLYSIITLLEDAVAKKPKIEQLANRISEYFSMIILTLAIGTFIGWNILEAPFEEALLVAISVVIIACPCALALATPIATLVGISAAMKRGVLFKATQYIETLSKADTVLFDKTGTLTKGQPEVSSITWHQEEAQGLVLGLVKASKHPVAQGVYRALEETYEALALEDVKTYHARGLEASYHGSIIRGGNYAMMEEAGVKGLPKERGDGIEFYVAKDTTLIMECYLDDPLKEGAKEMIDQFKALGLEVMMVTGDHQRSAKRIAKVLDIEVKSEMLPTDKAAMVDSLHDAGRIVVMVGDGINDSVALSKADIAVAMHSGADVAIDVSDVVILNNTLKSLYDAFRLARRTYGFIKQNMGISFAYNVVTVPLAMIGWIIPLFAAISMSLSSIMVVLNSMRIKQIKD